MTKKSVVVFGASGLLGSHCVAELERLGFRVIPVGRDLKEIKNVGEIHGAVWAQGTNFTGKFEETSSEEWMNIWNANFNFIVNSLNSLLEQSVFQKGSRLVVISSVWQEVSRSRKVAYIASKAAVGGLVRALAADFGDEGIAINAVLPGIVHSPMTEKNLTEEQILKIQESTPGGNLVKPAEVARVVGSLVSDSTSGINGQSIVVDHGWSITHHV